MKKMISKTRIYEKEVPKQDIRSENETKTALTEETIKVFSSENSLTNSEKKISSVNVLCFGENKDAKKYLVVVNYTELSDKEPSVMDMIKKQGIKQGDAIELVFTNNTKVLGYLKEVDDAKYPRGVLIANHNENMFIDESLIESCVKLVGEAKKGETAGNKITEADEL